MPKRNGQESRSEKNNSQKFPKFGENIKLQKQTKYKENLL